MANMQADQDSDAGAGPERPQQEFQGSHPGLYRRNGHRMRPSAACSARSRTVSRAARSIFIFPSSSHKVAEGDFEEAYEIITATNALPALSGRVCPQETQCESKCVRGIKGEPVAIGRLERFVADWYRENVNAMPKKAESNGLKVAVVGSGPSGLTCASMLAKKGYQVSHV